MILSKCKPSESAKGWIVNICWFPNNNLLVLAWFHSPTGLTRISGVTKYSPLLTQAATAFLPFGDLATLHFSGRQSLPNSCCTLLPELAALKIRYFRLIFSQILKPICPCAALAHHSHELTFFLWVLSLKVFLKCLLEEHWLLRLSSLPPPDVCLDTLTG